MFWQRTTKDIVISRKRRRQEQAALQQSKSEADDSHAESQETPEIQNEETILEETTLENTTAKKLDPKQLWIAGGCVVAGILILVLLLALPKNTTTIPEGMNVVALQNTALAGSVSTGDIVQLYASDGTVIPQLRYVQVCGVTESNGLLLAMEPVQAAAFARHDSVTAALVTQSGTQAEELLALQKTILYPSVKLQLPKTITLEPGETQPPDLTVTADPEDGIIPEITWESSDPDICSIDEGMLSADSIGKAVVTASCGEASASCTVEVRIPLTALQLSTTETSLAIGGTFQLTAAPEPQDTTNFTVSWESDNPAVATVAEDGTVTAVSGGTAMITAYCGDIAASCTVKVGVHTELVQLSQHDVTMAPEETLVLEYAISPSENNIDTVSFSSSDPETVTVGADGTITAVKSGQATITITCGNASDTCTVTVS